MSDKDNISMEAAAEWIQSLEYKWRLEILSKRALRTRDGLPVVDKDGVPKEIPTRIRRYVEGIPWPFVKSAIDHLIATAPYSGLIANGVDFGDAQYRPTLTVWQRDSGHVTHPPTQRGPDATYTLIQDLVEVKSNDTYAVGTQSTCSEEVVTTYVWDSPDVEELPGEAGEPGVTYAIAAVHRNEDGTFDYQVVKRTAITQESGWSVVRNDAVMKVEERLYDNVYPDMSDPDNPQKLPADIEALLDSSCWQPGEVVRVENLRHNADCTLSFTLVRETAKMPNRLRDTSKETQYEEDRGHTERAPDALPEAPDAHDGIITTHDSRLQPDGGYENTVETAVEQPVSNSVVRVQVGRKGRRVTREHRNQRNPASMSNVELGGLVEVKKTPGRLYDNTVSNFDQANPVKAGELCKEDLFNHVDAKTTGGATMPPDGNHVVGGVNGKVVTRRTEMDDDGAVTQTLETDQERSVPRAQESWRITLDGVTHQTVDRNQPSPAAAPTFSRENVGTAVENAKTPGGLYNVTRTEAARTPPLDTGSGCRTDIFAENDSTTTVDPQGSVSPIAHVFAGGGKIRERSARLNETGAAVVQEVVTTEKPVSLAQESWRVTLDGITHQTVDRNQLGPAEPPAFSRENVGTAVENAKTPGGLYNVTRTEAARTPPLDTGMGCRRTVFDEADSTTRVDPQGNVTPGVHVAAGGGRYRERAVRLNETGAAVVQTTTTREIEQQQSEKEYLGTSIGDRIRTLDRNLDEALMRAKLASRLDNGHPMLGKRSKWKLNPGGTYDFETVDFQLRDPDADGKRITKVQKERSPLGDVDVTIEVSDHPFDPSRLPPRIEAPGIIWQVEQTLTDDGTYELRTTKRTARPAYHKVHWVDYQTGRYTIVITANWLITFRNFRYVPTLDWGQDREFHVDRAHGAIIGDPFGEHGGFAWYQLNPEDPFSRDSVGRIYENAVHGTDNVDDHFIRGLKDTDSRSVSVHINEFGLYDGSIHIRSVHDKGERTISTSERLQADSFVQG